jgi:hypothetical protein
LSSITENNVPGAVHWNTRCWKPGFLGRLDHVGTELLLKAGASASAFYVFPTGRGATA